MKKAIALLLAAVLPLAAVGCGIFAPGDASRKKPGPDKRTFNVGVSIYKLDDSFMALYRRELEKHFMLMESDAVKYNVTIMDATGDQIVQFGQVDAFVAQGVDVMIINLVQSSSANDVTEKARAAGIPVVYVSREPGEEDMGAWDKICYVGVNLRQSGTYQGEIVRDLPDSGDADGDGVVRYAMIAGDPECSDFSYRSDFSIKALRDAGIVVEELFHQRGDGDRSKGRELAADALARFGAAVDVIFCNDDAMALGAAQAIKDAGRSVGGDIYLVGADAAPEALSAIIAGDMTGTVRNCPIHLSHATVGAAIKYAYGEQNNTYIMVDHVKVTAGNASLYIQ